MEKFDISSIKNNSMILILNSNDNSHLMRDIFYNKKDIPLGIVFSKETFYNEFIPDSLIHKEYDPELVNTLLDRQLKKIRKYRDRNDGLDYKIKTSSFIVVDNMLESLQKEKTIKEIFFNGRFHNIFPIFTHKHDLKMSPALASVIDYIFICDNSNDNYDNISKTFGIEINFEQLQTDEYLVIDTYNKKIFRYKPEEHSDFRICDPKIWEYFEKYSL